jgi:DNA-binding winged helix-turn-helix (wHTH) protein/Tol biopolymer transport system component
MALEARSSAILRFGVFEVDVRSRELRKQGARVKLQEQPFHVLTVLLQSPGEVISREELRSQNWPADTFVDFDNSLNTAINKLREALGDSADNPRFIETLPRRGYRFIAAVTEGDGTASGTGPGVSTAAPPSSRKIVMIAADVMVAAIPASIRRRWRTNAAIAAAALAMLAIGAALWLRSTTRLPDRSQWVPLTKFPDPVSQPALSQDGRMLAFIRGSHTFFGSGQVYVKILPDGQPVQLTHDNLDKMSPVFSPDGARIAYTTVDPPSTWDTWVVPTLGGEPQPWLINASGLVWTRPQQVMFSKMRKSPHMGIVAAEESRIGERDVYVPAREPGMAHRSYPSPDGKWVLVAEMDQDHVWTPCRVVPMDGTSLGHQVGPLGAACTFGAWSPDGRWMYFTSEAGGLYHIWRQRFPDGQPQQITSGPTEEEGIAMAPDGRSIVTAVGLESVSLWVHDARGERQISLEGNATEPKFTADGRKLCYRIVTKAPNFFQFGREAGEVWVADLDSGRSAPLASGFKTFAYDISADGQQVVLEGEDREGKPQLWLTSFERQLPPRPVPNVEGRQPRFGPSGEIFFRSNDGFVYRVQPDGTGMKKALEQSILMLFPVSPDGKWLMAWARPTENGQAVVHAFPLGGGPPVRIGNRIRWQWSPNGRFLSIALPLAEGRTYIVPLPPSEALPPIPAGGIRSEQDVVDLPGARRIDALRAIPSPSPGVYVFYHSTTQRNLYRIPIL